MGYSIYWQQGFMRRDCESLRHATEVHNRIEAECDCFSVEIDGLTVKVGVEVEKHLTRMDDQYRLLAAEGFEGFHVLIGEDGNIWAEVVGDGRHETMLCDVVVSARCAGMKELPVPRYLTPEVVLSPEVRA